MIKSQRSIVKLFPVFLIGFVMVCSSAICNDLKNELLAADSLFKQKKYVQSLQKYESIRQKGYASQAMLLKMAYINEAVDDIGGALYYLNIYYQFTHNKRVLNKMQAMAEEHNLSGYQYNDSVFFLNVFYNYKSHLTFLLFAVTVFMFGIIIYQMRKYKSVAIQNKVVMGVLAIAVLVMVNIDFEPDYGIISAPDVFIMEGPSSAAAPLEITAPGHRVKILGKKDIWMKIQWKEKTGYVRKHNLQYI